MITRRDLPMTFGSPTMSPFCADEDKYGVVERIVKDYEVDFKDGKEVIGQKISDMNTVNGVRITVEDGTWGLVRASSNTPNLVVVVESPTSEENKLAMFRDIEKRLGNYSEVGDFDQKI